MSRLKETYLNEIKDAMQKKFEYKNEMQIPKLDKIVINMGVGEAKENRKVLDTAVKDLETITGQKAVVTRAKNSVANFKLREGQPIGCKVTLRGTHTFQVNAVPDHIFIIAHINLPTGFRVVHFDPVINAFSLVGGGPSLTIDREVY